MTSHITDTVKCLSKKGILLVGSFAPNGTSAPAASGIEGRGIASVARTSRGLWTVTLNKTYPEGWSFMAALQHTDGTLGKALEIGTVSNVGSTSAVTLQVRNTGGTQVVKCVKEADDAAAATTTTEYPFHVIPTNGTGTITSVTYTPDAALTANATNYATITFSRRAASDYSTAIAAAARATDTVSTDDMVAFTPWALDLSGTAADLEVADNDVFTFKIAKAASGVAVSAGVLSVEITNTVDVAAAAANRVNIFAFFNKSNAF